MVRGKILYLAVLGLLSLSLVVAGCGKKPAEAPAENQETAAPADGANDEAATEGAQEGAEAGQDGAAAEGGAAEGGDTAGEAK